MGVLYRVSKKLSVKADLDIYSQVVDTSGQCMSVSSLIWISVLVTIWSVFVTPLTCMICILHMISVVVII